MFNNTYQQYFSYIMATTKKGALDSQPQVIVYQVLAHDRWFSPASSTTKTGRHDKF
jgi:hypothetical protein